MSDEDFWKMIEARNSIKVTRTSIFAGDCNWSGPAGTFSVTVVARPPFLSPTASTAGAP